MREIGGDLMNEFEHKLLYYVKRVLGSETPHDLFHTLRVVKIAKEIAEKEEADYEITIAAAYLHDIARPLEKINLSIDHAKKGAEIARKFLRELNFPKEKIEMVAQAIEEHRFRNGKIPRTLEGKVLQDADRLDAVGAIGIYRVIFYSCEYRRSIEDTIKHFEKKILKLKDTLHTKYARKLAEKRHKLVEDFVTQLKEEISI